ncbi:YtxH domain-containing protein [Virgibacillus sp. W0430]|uniref:YtxH domain-containing protein n=1 Tax=Virgibacillus sp. W0430 TaxID=3391580 RepID=UPI003F462609
MGKRNLCTGVLIGAIVGGVVSLFDKNTRDYTKNKWSETKAATASYFTNPAEAVHSLKQCVQQVNHTINNEAQNTINALEQVENTLTKVLKK